MGLYNSYAVDSKTGKKSDLCFERRELEKNPKNGTATSVNANRDGGASAPVSGSGTNKALIDTSTLVDAIDRSRRRPDRIAKGVQRKLDEGPYPHFFDVVSTESLLGYEMTRNDDTFQHTLDTWQRAFMSLGMHFDRDAVAAFLQPRRGKRHLKDHSETIYNIDAVRKVLETAEWPIRKYLRLY